MNAKRVSMYILGLFIVSVMLINSITLYAEELVFDAEYGFDVGISSPPWNTVTFYSNYTKLFYVFFNYNRPLVGWTAFYSTSFDGVNWSNATRLFFPDSGGAWNFDVGRWDFYLEPNGRYLHGAIVTGGTPNAIKYFKRELFMNGSWGVLDDGPDVPQLIFNEVLPGSHEANKYIDLYLDNESYPFITFTSYKSEGAWESGYLIEGDYPIPLNGTWGHGDYNVLDWQIEFGNLWDNDWKCTVTGLSDERTETGFGRGVHWMQTHESSLSSGLEWSASAHNYYNGSGWINHQFTGLGASALFDNEGDWADNCWDITAIGNITLYVKQTEQDTAPDVIQLSYGTRIGGQDWDISRHRVSSDYVGDAGAVQIAPKIGVDYNRNVVIVWTIHHPDNSSVWYRLGQIGFNGIITWQTNETLWEDWQQTGPWVFDSYGSGMAEPLPSNVPLSMSYEDTTDESIYHDYLFPLEGEELDLPTKHLNTTLYSDTDIFGNPIEFDGWIFEGDIYTFESYVTNATEFNLNFTDGQHNILFRWNNATKNLDIISDERFVIGEIYTNYTLFSGGVQRFIWRFIPDINIVDEENATVYYYSYNEDANYSVSGDTGIEANIYNLGGLTYYTFVGDGGRTQGGTPFELYATDGSLGSSARAEQIFRKLQHTHLLFEIDMGNEWDAGTASFDIDPGVGFIEMGVDWRLNNSWVNGYRFKMYVLDANVGGHAILNDHNWVKWGIDWYKWNVSSGLWIDDKNLVIYSNHWGYASENQVPQYNNRTSSQFFVDLWFDRTNASTTVAGQVNSFYYGMYEQGSSLWFGYGPFYPRWGDYENAKYLTDIHDETGNITNIQKYDLIKFWVKVEKTANDDGDDETWVIANIEDMHRELAIDRMGGIDEPTFVETKVLNMPQTGFLSALKSAINGLSKLIWGGAFQFVKLLMGAIGSLMNAIGLGEWWIGFSTMIERIAVLSMKMMDELKIALINSALLLTQIFNLIGAGIGRFVGVITNFISSLLLWYGHIVDLFTGGGLLSLNLWVGLNLEDFVMLAIHLLPVFWVNRLAKADDLLRTAQEDLHLVVWLITGLFSFLLTIVAWSIELFNFLLGLLPI